MKSNVLETFKLVQMMIYRNYIKNAHKLLRKNTRVSETT